MDLINRGRNAYSPVNPFIALPGRQFFLILYDFQATAGVMFTYDYMLGTGFDFSLACPFFKVWICAELRNFPKMKK